jgi:AhpD family alkylhydroperoxidase
MCRHLALPRLIDLKRQVARQAHGWRMNQQMSSFPQLTREISSRLAELRADQPALMRDFNGLARAAMADGALSAKTKELIALVLGVAGHCDGCIGFHAKALVGMGATKAEVEEALAVAIYMGGGPSLMYSANALAAYEQFTEAAAARTATS